MPALKKVIETSIAVKVEPLEQKISADIEAVKTASQDYSDGQGKVITKNIRDITKSAVETNEKNLIRFGALHDKFVAQAHLKDIDETTDSIHSLFEGLDALPIDEKWKKNFALFQNRLSYWETFSKLYPVSSFFKAVFDVHPGELSSNEWSDEVNELSTDDGLMYKHYKIYKRNYCQNKDELRRLIAAQAEKHFIGDTCKPQTLEYFKKY